jgi:hypothetical protein
MAFANSGKRNIQTSQLISLLKTKIYEVLTTEDGENPETGEIIPAVSAKDLASLTSSAINISKHEQELKKSQGLGNNVMAFPALPPVNQKEA